jgi:hypothetical protein
MLVINECRTCNADKATCPIKKGLQDKLKGIKERLKYRCKGWQQHLKYKVGDKVVFHFIEYGEHGGELSGETLTGKIFDISKKSPVYQVIIDQENRNKIDPEFSNYDKYVSPYHEDVFDFHFKEPTHYTVPVKEQLITGVAD